MSIPCIVDLIPESLWPSSACCVLGTALCCWIKMISLVLKQHEIGSVCRQFLWHIFLLKRNTNQKTLCSPSMEIQDKLELTVLAQSKKKKKKSSDLMRWPLILQVLKEPTIAPMCAYNIFFPIREFNCFILDK